MNRWGVDWPLPWHARRLTAKLRLDGRDLHVMQEVLFLADPYLQAGLPWLCPQAPSQPTLSFILTNEVRGGKLGPIEPVIGISRW